MPSLIVIGHISNLILMMERKVRIECDKQRKAKVVTFHERHADMTTHWHYVHR